MSDTNFAKNKIQDLMYGGVSFSPPANYYIALSKTTVSSSGSNITEPIGSGYTRVLVPNTKSYFTYSTSGCLVNSSNITFPQSSGSWGTITDIVLMDSLTTGSAWMYTVLDAPKVIDSNTVVSFSASAIIFSQS